MAHEEGGTPERLEAEDARLAVARNEVQVVDVRPAEDFAEERINGSVRADPDDLEAALKEIDEEQPLLIVSADGDAGEEIAERLRGEGRSAANLEGGFDAWTGEGLPTAPGQDEEYEGPDVKIPGAVASSGAPDEDEQEEDEGEERWDDQGT